MPRLVPLALVAIALAACSHRPTSAAPPGTGTVVRPVDGDTVVVRVGGVDEPVRLIGIDTPESVAEDRPVECYGLEAKHRLATLLPSGTLVRLERDVEARDRYDRLLAYVVRAEDGVLVNEVLVAEGFAEAAPFPPNLARQRLLDEAEAIARAEGRGLWPACGGTDAPIASSPGAVASAS